LNYLFHAQLNMYADHSRKFKLILPSDKGGKTDVYHNISRISRAMIQKKRVQLYKLTFMYILTVDNSYILHQTIGERYPTKKELLLVFRCSCNTWVFLRRCRRISLSGELIATRALLWGVTMRGLLFYLPTYSICPPSLTFLRKLQFLT